MKRSRIMIGAIVVSMAAVVVPWFCSPMRSRTCWRSDIASHMVNWPAWTEPIRLGLVDSEVKRWNAFDAEIERHSEETETMYRIEFLIPTTEVKDIIERIEDRGHLDATRLKVSDFFKESGVTPHPGSSAILDTHTGSLVCINNGFNVCLIKQLMNPFSPTRFGKP